MKSTLFSKWMVNMVLVRDVKKLLISCLWAAASEYFPCVLLPSSWWCSLPQLHHIQKKKNKKKVRCFLPLVAASLWNVAVTIYHRLLTCRRNIDIHYSYQSPLVLCFFWMPFLSRITISLPLHKYLKSYQRIYGRWIHCHNGPQKSRVDSSRHMSERMWPST